jgi:hypothetical protein
MKEPKQSAPDWERIEADYRAGILSLREIAAPHGITEGGIRRRAKSKGWSRDLAAKIKARAEDLVRKEAVRAECTQPEYGVPEHEIVEVNAQIVASVDRRHKETSSRAQKLISELIAELEAQTGNIELFDQLGDLLDRSTDDSEGRGKEDKLNRIYQAVISMGGRIDGLKKLVETFEKLSKFERLAYRLDDAPTKPPDEPGGEIDNETARRVAFLLSKGLRAKKA